MISVSAQVLQHMSAFLFVYPLQAMARAGAAASTAAARTLAGNLDGFRATLHREALAKRLDHGQHRFHVLSSHQFDVRRGLVPCRPRFLHLLFQFHLPDPPYSY